MKNVFLVSFCILLCIMNITLLSNVIKCYNKNTEKEIVINKYQDYIFDFLISNIDVSDETLEHNIFKDTKSESIMIYRFFNEQCNRCVVDELSFLKEVQKKYAIKILVLHPKPQNRQEDILNINMLSGLDFEYVSENEFNIDDVGLVNRRFIAVLKKDGTMTDILMLNFKLTSLIDAYFNKKIKILEKE